MGQDKSRKDSQSGDKGFFTSLLNGDYGLGETYWLFGVLGPAFVVAIFNFIMGENQLVLRIFCILLIFYIVFINIAIWNASKKPGVNAFWASAARLAVIFGVLLPVIGVTAVIFISSKNHKHEYMGERDNSASYGIEFQEAAPHSRADSSTMTPQANQQSRPQVVPAPAQTEQLSPEERFALAVKDLERRYSIYNTGSQSYSQEAVDSTLNKMNELVAAGYDPASALLMAGDSVAPFYMQRLYDAAAQTQLSERAAQVNTPPYQSKQRKAVVGSGSVPAYEPDKCQFKPVMTDEDLRNCGIFKK